MVDYEKLWGNEKFRKEKCRAALHCEIFLALWRYLKDHTNEMVLGVHDTIVDWGCGNGSHASLFMGAGFLVTGLNDIAPNALDEDIMLSIGDLFEAEPICDAQPVPAHYSYCTDVLEHIDEKDIVPSLENIVRNTKRPGFIFLNVASKSDMWDGEELHVTRKSKEWWMDVYRSVIPGICIAMYNMMNDSYGTLWFLEGRDGNA